MKLLLINGIFFIVCAFMGIYSMKKNDKVITNKWLFLLGWFLSVFVLCLGAMNFLYFFIDIGVLKFNDKVILDIQEYITLKFTDYVAGVATIIFSLYLYSLRKKCMSFELLPRTFKIFVQRGLNKFRYGKMNKAIISIFTL